MARKEEKKREQELKAPDEFQKLGETAVPFLEKHGRTVLIAVCVVVGAFLVVSISRSLTAKGEETAVQDLATALKVLDREVNANATTPPPAGTEAPFKSETERDEALISKLSEFRGKHTGKSAAAAAALPLAQAYLRQGKAQDSVALVDEFLRVADAADPMRATAYEARGYALESQKKYDEALSAFDQLARENKTDFMKGMGLYHRGRMLQLKGDGQAAAKQFSELQTQAPDTAAARLAKDRLALLASQGIVIAPPPMMAVDGGM
jgi:tetratricopeptide (TPR) repeat protein